MSNDNQRIEKQPELSSEAIDFAKRMIALGWTKETDIKVIAGSWQAGYIFGQIDKEQQIARLLVAKEAENKRLREALEKSKNFLEDIVHEKGIVKSGISLIIEDWNQALSSKELVDTEQQEELWKEVVNNIGGETEQHNLKFVLEMLSSTYHIIKKQQ